MEGRTANFMVVLMKVCEELARQVGHIGESGNVECANTSSAPSSGGWHRHEWY